MKILGSSDFGAKMVWTFQNKLVDSELERDRNQSCERKEDRKRLTESPNRIKDEANLPVSTTHDRKLLYTGGLH